MSMNAIVAAQGIQIWRWFHARYPSKGTDAKRAVPRNILEQIIWDKEVEVIQRKARTPLSDMKASAVLAPPPRDFLGALHAACHRNGEVPALIAEVHDERELDRVLKVDGVELIGINNRSLVDTANTNMLLEKRGYIIKKKRIQVVSESGLFTPDDVAYVQNAGIFTVLVGESLLAQEDPGRANAGLFGKELLP
ncbi:unnamed protein product [Miscanthus lutarioriparius]|uniref:indole-3-glycerol-phosphate synthase n=1 Tax=Miscanthus lutarioriparius TaxID=422564 RepID=A0A811NCC5_9POAL|nr:unnamed protein product [Miscanthus lutarioriparius]